MLVENEMRERFPWKTELQLTTRDMHIDAGDKIRNIYKIGTNHYPLYALY